MSGRSRLTAQLLWLATSPTTWIGKCLEGQRGPASDRTGALNTSGAELIFELYRANDPLLPMHPRTVLGLYISRQLAERHNGKLTVAYSEPGQGSTLVLALPPGAGLRWAGQT